MSDTSLVKLEGYDNFLCNIKQRIQTAQVRAALAVNRELVILYWQIGKDILTRQQQQGWGAKVIDRLAIDLKSAFPGMKGFSRTNLLYMRAFAEAYPDEEFVQQVVGQIPWGHHVRILDFVKDPAVEGVVYPETLKNMVGAAISSCFSSKASSIIDRVKPSRIMRDLCPIHNPILPTTTERPV